MDLIVIEFVLFFSGLQKRISTNEQKKSRNVRTLPMRAWSDLHRYQQSPSQYLPTDHVIVAEL